MSAETQTPNTGLAVRRTWPIQAQGSIKFYTHAPTERDTKEIPTPLPLMLITTDSNTTSNTADRRSPHTEHRPLER